MTYQATVSTKSVVHYCFQGSFPPQSLPQEFHSFNITSLPDSHFQSLLSIAIYSCYYWVTNRKTCDRCISLCSSLGFYKPRSSGNLYLQNVCMHHDSQHLKPVCSTDIQDTDTERYTCTRCMHKCLLWVQKQSWPTFLAYCFTLFESNSSISVICWKTWFFTNSEKLQIPGHTVKQKC